MQPANRLLATRCKKKINSEARAMDDPRAALPGSAVMMLCLWYM